MRIHTKEDNEALTILFSLGDCMKPTDPVVKQVVGELSRSGFEVVVVYRQGLSASNHPDVVLASLIRKAAKSCHKPVVLAGISRGARLSVELCAELSATALLLFAYPFHGRTDANPRGRDQALARVPVPTLLCQGTRDSHGNQQQVRSYSLPPRVRLHWLTDANHNLVPRVRTGLTQHGLLQEALAVAVTFLKEVAC